MPLLAAATLVLWRLERAGLIRTMRLDDYPKYAPNQLLREVEKNGERFIEIHSPMMVRTRVRAHKPRGALRVILLGESFMMGTPYGEQSLMPVTTPEALPGSPAAWLSAMFALRFPKRNVEVINAGAGSADSAVVGDIQRQLLALAPDLFVVAVGNNGSPPPQTLNRMLHGWVLYRLGKKILLREPRLEERPFFLIPDSSDGAMDRFRQSLEAMARTASEHGVRLILSTMPINWRFDYRCARTYTEMLAEQDAPIDEGLRAMRDGRYAEALDILGKSDSILTARWIAECLEKLGRYDEAREMYAAYITGYKGCRTQPAFNAMVRKLAEARGLPVADLQKKLDDAGTNGMADARFFHDSCHLRRSGYYLAAAEIFPAIVASGFIPSHSATDAEPPSADEIMTQRRWPDMQDLERRKDENYARAGINDCP